jgi:hypothetical protein
MLAASGDSTATLYKMTDSGGTVAYSALYSSGVSPSLGTNGVLMLKAVGSTLTVYVNGTIQVTFTTVDTTYATGQTGVYNGSNTSGGTFVSTNLP